MNQLVWLLVASNTGMLFFSLWQWSKNKKRLAQFQQELNQKYEEIQNLQLAKEQESSELAHKKETYFKHLSVAFNNGGEIIAQTTNNFQKSEELLVENIKSIDALTSSTESVKQKTSHSISIVKDLEQSTHELKSVNDEHKLIIEKLQDVQKKCQNINDIAFKSKLLSFNAAVEAAQAGEHGKGFSVVADEVQDMANTSRTVSDDINQAVMQSLELMLKISKKVEENIDNTLSNTDAVKEDIVDFDRHMNNVFEIVKNVNLHADVSREEIKSMGNDSKTELENLNKILSDVIGLVTEREIVDLDPKDCNRHLNEFVVIDVRNPHEWNDELGHIESAIHYCLHDNLKDKLEPLDRNQKYLFVCRSGGRSARAARIAQALGFTEVYNMEGGMLEWKHHNLKSVWDNQAA
jgi:rhodanese-related sulfurtransferase